MASGHRNTAEAELEGKARNIYPSIYGRITETPVFGRVNQPADLIEKWKQNSGGLTK